MTKSNPQNELSIKDKMETHSKAKVDFYCTYLERYLSIMANLPYVHDVYIFDPFCGQGVFKDGGHGSPIRAVETIIHVMRGFYEKGCKMKVHLYINDVNEEYINRNLKYIEENLSEYKKYCRIMSSTMNARQIIQAMPSILTALKNPYSLMFIDPYGYKHINANELKEIMLFGKTDIILFCPVVFLYRFAVKACSDSNDPSCASLRQLLNDLLGEKTALLNKDDFCVDGFIKMMAEGLTFNGMNFCAPYQIERDARSKYALFCMTNARLGLEVAIDAKWKLSGCADGFHLDKSSGQLSLFDDYDKEQMNRKYIEETKLVILNLLREGKATNVDIVINVLLAGYRIPHATKALTELEKNKIIEVALFYKGDHRPGVYYLSKKDPKILIELKK